MQHNAGQANAKNSGNKKGELSGPPTCNHHEEFLFPRETRYQFACTGEVTLMKHARCALQRYSMIAPWRSERSLGHGSRFVLCFVWALEAWRWWGQARVREGLSLQPLVQLILQAGDPYFSSCMRPRGSEVKLLGLQGLPPKRYMFPVFFQGSSPSRRHPRCRRHPLESTIHESPAWSS